MTIKYEVQSLRDGQWMINFYRDSRDDAISDAYYLMNDDKVLKAVKVTAEYYNESMNKADERMIFSYDRDDHDREKIKKSIKLKPREKIKRDVAPPQSLKAGAAKKAPSSSPSHSQSTSLHTLLMTTIGYLVLIGGGAYMLVKYMVSQGWIEKFW